MALTKVRVKLGATWTTLTYNASTGRYEGYITPPGTSFHQPGGYFNLDAEATNQNGLSASISGTELPSLRLVVRETAAPTLTLVSPSPGYLLTQTPTFTVDAVDEEGGSGVNPDSFQSSQTGTVSRTAITRGYRYTWSPAVPWADGAHTVTFSVRDYDGNQSTVSGAYIVDTAPPELILTEPYQRHVVDDESVTISGEAWDITSPEIAVTVAGKAAPVAERRFSSVVPLAIGENHILVTVTDGAGNVTTAEVYMIRLVTDRTQGDVAFLQELYTQYPKFDDWPETTRAWFLQAACLRGAYDSSDWNRVGVAVQWLAGELQRRGYIANVQPKTNWTENDTPTQTPMETYRKNVETVRDAQNLWWLEMLPLPYTMRNSGYQDWNDLEKALVETDAVFPRYTSWSSGEVSCGEG